MVSSGDGEIGAAKLTDEVFTIVTKVPELVRSLTGVDILKVSYCRMTSKVQITYLSFLQ